MHLRLDLHNAVQQLLNYIVPILLVRLLDALQFCICLLLYGRGGGGLFAFVLMRGGERESEGESEERGEDEWTGSVEGTRGQEMMTQMQLSNDRMTHLLLVLLVLLILASLELLNVLCRFTASVLELLGSVWARVVPRNQGQGRRTRSKMERGQSYDQIRRISELTLREGEGLTTPRLLDDLCRLLLCLEERLDALGLLSGLFASENEDEDEDAALISTTGRISL